MSFYEQELKKIVSPVFPNATYVGRSCFVWLDENTRAKVFLETEGFADHYSALRVNILNKSVGQIDTVLLRFADLWNRRDAYIWDDYGKVDWYGFSPSRSQYEALTEAVSNYLGVFQEQGMELYNAPQWGQTM